MDENNNQMNRRGSFSSVESWGLSKDDLDSLLVDRRHERSSNPQHVQFTETTTIGNKNSPESQLQHTIACPTCGKVISFPCNFGGMYGHHGRRESDLASFLGGIEGIESWEEQELEGTDRPSKRQAIDQKADNRHTATNSNLEGDISVKSQLDFHLKRLLSFMSESEKSRRFTHLKIKQMLSQDELEQGSRPSFADIKASRRKPRRRKTKKTDEKEESKTEKDETTGKKSAR